MALKLKKGSNLIIITECGVIRNIFTVRKMELIEFIEYFRKNNSDTDPFIHYFIREYYDITSENSSGNGWKADWRTWKEYC